MEDEDYRIMVLNDTTMKVFRDGRIHTLHNRRKRWTDRKFSETKDGYYRVAIGNPRKDYCVHYLVVLCYLGERPNGKQVDHINGNNHDNRLDNLQYINPIDNYRKRLYCKKGELIKGFRKTKCGKFRATIGHNGKDINLGSYDTEAEARQAYVDAKLKYHKVEIEIKQ